MDTNNLKIKAKHSFFASSNSFDGFVSYFDKCFYSKNFDKVFVIKGGPGTGKSTLMRKLSKLADGINCDKEEIYCSSDTNSLDGIIIKGEKSSIAMLDGTAPHERDAVIPGAVDIIINLGNFFDIKGLEAAKKDIVHLCDKKNVYYEKAYEQMHFSSIFARKSKAEKLKCFKSHIAEEEANLIIRAIYSEGDYKRSVRLISAFGKDGYFTLNTLNLISDRIYSIKGDRAFAEAFIKIIEHKLMSTDADFCIFPNPLDKGMTEAIYIPKTKTAVVIGDNEGSICDINKFVSKDYSYTDEIKEYDKTSEKFLDKAKEYFNLASENHFKLEGIYSENVDFNSLNEYSENLMSYIKNILS